MWLCFTYVPLYTAEDEDEESDDEFPMAPAPDGDDDPYKLTCAGGGYGCSLPPSPTILPPPTSCYRHYCNYIRYINKPWQSTYKGVLQVQPVCYLNIGNRVYKPGKIRVRLYFYKYQASIKEIKVSCL